VSKKEQPMKIVELRSENVKRLKAVRIRPDGAVVVIKESEKVVGSLIDPDLADIRKRISQAEMINERVRLAKDRAALDAQLQTIKKSSEELTEKLTEIDQRKANLLSEAKFPVPGLGFDGDEVTLDDLPLQQASSAEQLRVSVAMGLALNPKLRVMLVRDGSLLDEESLAMVAKMSEEADAQIWIEQVDRGQKVGVVIEDGHVEGVEEPEMEEKQP